MASNVTLPCCGYVHHPDHEKGDRYTTCPACGTPCVVHAQEHYVIEYTARPTHLEIS